MVKNNLDEEDDEEAADLDEADDDFIPNKLSLNEKPLDSVECSLEISSKDLQKKTPSINGLTTKHEGEC